jgi:nitroreductase
LILCADLKSWDKDSQRYWKNASKEIQDFMVPAIEKFYKGNDQLQRDEALRSVGIAAQTLMLSAKSAGYDSCPMIGFDPEKIAELE